MIPQSYEEWKNCIVNDCKINLSKEFAQKRLKIFEDRKNPETRNFIKLCGEEHVLAKESSRLIPDSSDKALISYKTIQ